MRVGHYDTDRRVLLVAEVGNNHEGSFERAQALVRAAADSGADAVKFQTFRTALFISASDRQRYERLRGFELPFEQVGELQALAKSLGLLFISTPLDLGSAAFLAKLVDAFKIASGDNNFFPLIAQVCATGVPVILSSGASDIDHMRRSKAFVEDCWRRAGITQDLAVLHCVSSYPTPADQANLAAIGVLARELGGTIGYSDHTLGIDASVLAVAAGARIIEKHFTLDKQMSSFRDHQLSADPAEMRRLAREIERVSVFLGRPEKVLLPCEEETAAVIRRSIVAAADLPGGHRLTMNDLTWMRPPVGVAPGSEALLIGKSLKRPLAFGEPVLPSDLE